MTAVSSRIATVCMAASVAVMMSAAPLSAQPGPGWGGMGWGGMGGGWGPGMMMGPGMMGPGAMWGGGMCSPRAAGLAEWRTARIEEQVKPNDEQRQKLNELRDASAKAAKIITAACPSEMPQSPVARLELMEKRLTAMLESIKIVRPAFETFYKSLTSEQQARLNVAGPRGWGWRRWQSREQQPQTQGQK